jgi:RNA polymerase sigma-70 factor (ECF subfamily)
MVSGLTSRRPGQSRAQTPVPNDFAHLSDEALVALVARSDDTAFAELYDRYGRLAYGLAHRVLRDGSLAEDAVQDAFLAIWRTASRFNAERAPARTWILTLVHRRAVDLVRHHERRRADPLPPQHEETGDAGADETVWLRLQRDRVRDALRQLPDQQREAIELAYYGGFSQSELAERLGQPLGTIKSRMFAGLTRLRELLEDATSEGDPWSGTTFTA